MRTIPDPGFAGDDGDAPASLTAALAAYDETPETYLHVLDVLQDERLLVPVVAVLGEVEYDEQGLAHDKTSDMATVLMTGRDGRLALLAFSGTDAMHRWNPDARPVPAELTKVAAAAVQDGASAIVLDIAGPEMFVVEQPYLEPLARGYRPVEGE